MTVIFEDLEIDVTNIMTDPVSFSKEVHEAANRLKDILKEDTSIERYIQRLPKEDIDYKDFDSVVNALWYMIDADYPIQAMKELSKKLHKLASDIEYMATSKAIDELAKKENIVDKHTAHQQYIQLREKYNHYCDTMDKLNILKKMGSNAVLEKLPSMPGNYGSPVGLVHYAFIFDGDDEVYRNPYAVCKRLGIEKMNLMDTVDYCEKNDVKVTVKKLSN